jgi:hypothetical protein
LFQVLAGLAQAPAAQEPSGSDRDEMEKQLEALGYLR